MRPPRNAPTAEEQVRPEFEETTVEINRITRVVKGGRRMRFRALVVVGNRDGKVGVGVAKASEVQLAVQKASAAAKRKLVTVDLTAARSIAHEVQATYGSSTVLLKPAGIGTSLIAGGSARSVLSLVGVENVLSKSLGSNNKMNVVMATLAALAQLRTK
jgi:small subunit ribosomal protein S5